MVVLLPAKDRCEAFEAELTAEQLQDIVDDLAPRQVWLTLPKLNYTSAGFRLKPMLEGLGMAEAFTAGKADCSGIDDAGGLVVSDVHHKAAMIVDEEGTEAAAATGVGLAGSALIEPPVEMRVDRPFIFLIRDTRTGALLFVGRIVDPRW